MRAIVIPRYGGPEVLRAEDRPTPQPGPGELLIAVTASGVRVTTSRYVSIAFSFAVTAGSTWQYVLSGGEITSSEFFPRSTVMGVDFSLGGALAIARGKQEVRPGWGKRFRDAMTAKKAAAKK